MQWAGKQAENKTFVMAHTTYSRNNMGQKCEGNCGLWVLNEIIEKKKSWKFEKNHGRRLGVTSNWAGLAVLFSR